MKLYVISETHGNVDKALEVYTKLHSIDLIVHLGDMERDVKQISHSTGKPVISVRGNNESYNCAAPDWNILETEYGNILLTHGHRQSVKSNLQKLLYRARELECRAALFGHTHMPFYTEEQGIHLLNPGSLCLPLDGTSGSYAIVNTSKDSFSASIVYYSQLSKI